MLQFQRSKFLETIEHPVAQGFTVTAEGQALVMDYTGGIAGVKPSQGTSGEQYIGASVAQQLTIYEYPEFVRIPSATATYELPHAPISGSVRVADLTTGTDLTVASGAPAAGEYSINGKVLTINAAEVGNSLQVSLRFVPTTMEALGLQGDIPPGGAANLLLGTMGIITKGIIATTMYDTAVNWQVANPVLRLGAGGRYTLAGSGTTISARILNLPTAADPFLVFQPI